MNQEYRSAPVVTIKAGNSLSEVIALDLTSLLGFVAPAAWTAAQLSIEASVDGLVWLTTLYDSQGNLIGAYAAITTGAGYAVDPLAFAPYRFVRFRSGTQGAPVNQAADAVITVVTRPLA